MSKLCNTFLLCVKKYKFASLAAMKNIHAYDSSCISNFQMHENVCLKKSGFFEERALHMSKQDVWCMGSYLTKRWSDCPGICFAFSRGGSVFNLPAITILATAQSVVTPCTYHLALLLFVLLFFWHCSLDACQFFWALNFRIFFFKSWHLAVQCWASMEWIVMHPPLFPCCN